MVDCKLCLSLLLLEDLTLSKAIQVITNHFLNTTSPVSVNVRKLCTLKQYQPVIIETHEAM